MRLAGRRGLKVSITRILSCSALLPGKHLTSNASSQIHLAAAFALPSKNLSRPYSTTTTFAMSSDEVEKAKEAAANNAGDGQPLTIFDKILSGDIPANKIHDDDFCIAFRDVSPQAPVHFLVIPKNRDGLTQLSKAREDQKELLGHLMYVAQKLGQEECPEGFRVVVNDGQNGAQSVYHLHLHVMGGRQMQWPPG
mmetsp:Transcript_24583/g.53836  ORF Transcript_24583/g.53836 Transcript_24583/m.53836 type:complete len:195 (-) Transcript_24583:1586-2170(-)|eukprot:CAMPEP_0168174516 /NCGR_PEP_ID=MMETSP0139_2-20121125/6551_1 /TAXON_ID=44445 /ORGANISM="Pseudo-nitzschia australis, Strain 10249 10 AB" /LENGTH=194 /DNA_ID=CAMNT_0008092683 /DNA_START=143 /DNA_END=727 /DNA_ORIENTATION=+